MNPTENLPVFPNFARPTGQYPGGWMNHSSGDVYCYYEGNAFYIFYLLYVFQNEFTQTSAFGSQL